MILTHQNYIRMRILLSFLALCFVYSSFAQVPAYYNNVNLNASGQTLKNNLATKVINSQNQTVSYTPGIWNALRQTDLDANNSSRVVLIYGYNDSDGNSTTDRTRSKYSNGGGSTDWNREHVYPKSLGTPTFGNSGPGSDPHQIRASDVNRNASRGNRKFASGSGNSAITSQGHWYPGDEFKGDVARILMYMYLRYGTRCLPKNVGEGSTVSNDQNMVELGRQIYKGGNNTESVTACAACHGPNGGGNPPAKFPALAGQHAKYTKMQLVAFSKGERANDSAEMMRNIADNMSEEEMTAVSEYIAGLQN